MGKVKILHIDGELPREAQEMLALFARKLGAYSVLNTKGGLDALKTVPCDLMTDTLTPAPLLHALIAQDAEALKLIYRLYLEEGIETKRLVHELQPFNRFGADWKALLERPQKTFQYYDEILTGEALKMRLLKQDAYFFKDGKAKSWPQVCLELYRNELEIWEFDKEAAQIFESGASDHCLWQGASEDRKVAAKPTQSKTKSRVHFGMTPNRREDLTELHLLLAFFYAMQPGVFSFSAEDLLGALDDSPLDLKAPNVNTVYPSFKGQMQNPKSFARRLKNILALREKNGIAFAELYQVPKTSTPGLLVLVTRKGSLLQLLAVNFGKTPASHLFEAPEIRHTTAIDVMSGLGLKKPLESASCRIELPPLSGKLIYFQPKSI